MALFSLSLIPIAIFALGLLKGVTSFGWLATEGRVLTSDLEVDSDGHFDALVVYSYDINGPYQGHNVHVVSDTPFFGNGQDVAQSLVQRYPVGSFVTVYYNPANPCDAVLEPGVYLGNYPLLLSGLILILLVLLERRL